jgi:carbamate kinase
VLVVVAVGGNALLRRDEPPEADVQQRNVATAAVAIAEVAAHRDVVVTHGNGPQIGLLALQAAAYGKVSPYPLDVLGAESEGMIGYLIEQEIANHLPGREVCSLLTRTVVDPNDPAFETPDKPIGPVYEPAEARRLAAERGWTIAPEGSAYRRVVPSPRPQRILELKTIELLVGAGVLVVCAGGGGIPVMVTPEGSMHGVEAVIDKDHSAALLAISLKADGLLLLTDVLHVWTDWNTPNARPLKEATPDRLAARAFAPGSMAPKIAAACRFATETGAPAGIGALADAMRILEGSAGTRVRPGTDMETWYDDPAWPRPPPSAAPARAK